MSALLQAFLQKLVKTGALEIEFFDGRRCVVGDGSLPTCTMKIADRRAESALAFDPEMALGDLYMNGRIEMIRGEIYDLIALAAMNISGGAPTRQIALWQNLRRVAIKLRPGVRPGRSRANVAHHYDLDRRLYKLFLDHDLQYSCAYFDSPHLSLEAAQLAKKRHIAAKLAVVPGQKILDIGCGWGGLALYLAEICEAEVYGVTLSREQAEIASERAENAGLEDRICIRLEDYRRVQGRFDRIVSVGMFEHVGPKHYDAFFARVAELLTEDGVALIHTIGHFGRPAPTNPWVTKYIFPDGYLPGLTEIAPALARAGLIVADLETLRDHYALTLEHWRARFKQRREEARAIYGERFCRMWEFYLAVSECAFRFQGSHVLQFQLVKKIDALPITRDYMRKKEAELQMRESARQGLGAAAE
jgi:cyclopropane-fatty-acyl-phospholipid synthase